MKNYDRADMIHALRRVEQKYPSVFKHFFLAEIDPELYKQFMDNLGKDNDSRQSDPGLGQEQETYQG
jgi:hypothetical protein